MASRLEADRLELEDDLDSERQKVAEIKEQRDRLLAAVKEHRDEWDEDWRERGGPPPGNTTADLHPIWVGDEKLYKLAQELEEEAKA